MTFREKLAKEHPEEIADVWCGGCHNCPCSYGYENYQGAEHCENTTCKDCWDREFPTEQHTEKTYEEGLQDAWKLAGRCVSFNSEGRLKIFDTDNAYCILRGQTYEEALAKLKSYEEAQEIKVGDVVLYGKNSTEKFLVIADDNQFVWVYSHESSVQNIRKDELRKTGRKLDITSLLGQIRGE